MALKIFKRLDWSFVKNFGGRKNQNYTCVIVNVQNKEIYGVPRNMEHIDFLCKLLSMDNIKEGRDYIKNNPKCAAHLVPSIIELRDNMVYRVITGVSGAEIGYNVRHTKEQLEQALSLVLIFIENGEIVKHPDFGLQLIDKYAKDNF